MALCSSPSRLGRQLDFERVCGGLECGACLLLFFEDGASRLAARMIVPAHAPYGGIRFIDSGLSVRYPRSRRIGPGAPILEVLDLWGVGLGRGDSRGDRLVCPT
jgi:hypothetical protein